MQSTEVCNREKKKLMVGVIVMTSALLGFSIYFLYSNTKYQPAKHFPSSNHYDENLYGSIKDNHSKSKNHGTLNKESYEAGDDTSSTTHMHTIVYPSTKQKLSEKQINKFDKSTVLWRQSARAKLKKQIRKQYQDLVTKKNSFKLKFIQRNQPFDINVVYAAYKVYHHINCFHNELIRKNSSKRLAILDNLKQFLLFFINEQNTSGIVDTIMQNENNVIHGIHARMTYKLLKLLLFIDIIEFEFPLEKYEIYYDLQRAYEDNKFGKTYGDADVLIDSKDDNVNERKLFVHFFHKSLVPCLIAYNNHQTKALVSVPDDILKFLIGMSNFPVKYFNKTTDDMCNVIFFENQYFLNIIPIRLTISSIITNIIDIFINNPKTRGGSKKAAIIGKNRLEIIIDILSDDMKLFEYLSLSNRAEFYEFGGRVMNKSALKEAASVFTDNSLSQEWRNIAFLLDVLLGKRDDLITNMDVKNAYYYDIAFKSFSLAQIATYIFDRLYSLCYNIHNFIFNEKIAKIIKDTKECNLLNNNNEELLKEAFAKNIYFNLCETKNVWCHIRDVCAFATTSFGVSTGFLNETFNYCEYFYGFKTIPNNKKNK